MSEEIKFLDVVASLNTFQKDKGKIEILVEGIEEDIIMKSFLEAISEAIENDEAGELPADVIDFYNNNLADDEEEGAEETAEEPSEKTKSEEKPKKKKKEPKEKKPRKSKVEKDDYGCTVGSGANKINELMANGGRTIPQLIEEVGTTRSRVTSHMGSLKKKGFFLDNIDGVYHLLKEKPPERPKPEKPKKEKKTKSTEKKSTEKSTEKKKKKKSSPKKETKKETKKE